MGSFVSRSPDMTAAELEYVQLLGEPGRYLYWDFFSPAEHYVVREADGGDIPVAPMPSAVFDRLRDLGFVDDGVYERGTSNRIHELAKRLP